MLADNASQPIFGCSCCLPRRGFLRAAMMAGAASFAATQVAEAQTAAPAASPQAASGGYTGMIIDCHGHYTTEPQPLLDWRKRQIAALNDPSQTPRPDELKISDDQFLESVERN